MEHSNCGPVRVHSRPGTYGLLLALTLAVKQGGTQVLRQFDLGWRRWLDSVLSLLAVVLLAAFLVCLLRWVVDSDGFPAWVKQPVAILGTLGTVLLLAVEFFLFLLFGNFSDRVMEWEGRKVVAEHTGIFEETGYRYVNWLVHGERLYVWDD